MGELPSMGKCKQCGKTFPVRAQMLVDGASIPMFVVLSEVDSMETALAAATCQLCLQRKGDPRRGLVEVLKGLGIQAAPLLASPIPRGQRHNEPLRVNLAVMVGPPAVTSRPVVVATPARDDTPSLSRVAIVIPTRQRPDVLQFEGRRDDDAFGQPRSMRERRLGRRALEPEESPLTSAIGELGENRDRLAIAQGEIQRQEEARRLERAQRLEQFDKLIFYLRLALARIRRRAATRRVKNLVESFLKKVGEAVKVDPQHRNRKGILALLGTSKDELEILRQRTSLPVPNPPLVSGDHALVDVLCEKLISEFWSWLQDRRESIGIAQSARIGESRILKKEQCKSLADHLLAFLKDLRNTIAVETAVHN
ncbi:hypothetical protein EPN81_04955 [Patescibacteria group bacterium]|nr:MAG: hypothetical protein EPN81_04955 [Patescibacteria group bacterium]